MACLSLITAGDLLKSVGAVASLGTPGIIMALLWCVYWIAVLSMTFRITPLSALPVPYARMAVLAAGAGLAGCMAYTQCMPSFGALAGAAGCALLYAKRSEVDKRD